MTSERASQITSTSMRRVLKKTLVQMRAGVATSVVKAQARAQTLLEALGASSLSS